MSNNSNIYPMAFVPNNQVVCKLHYVGFPNAWKEKLIKVEKIMKPKWNGAYALPTYALKKSLGAWMDGMIELFGLGSQFGILVHENLQHRKGRVHKDFCGYDIFMGRHIIRPPSYRRHWARYPS